ATKPAYLGTSYGATHVGGAGTALVLADGQQFAGVTLSIHKGGVITGTIRDELGQPMQGATAQVMQYRALTNGERRLAQMGASERTDDRGVYRIFGLSPGEYFVAASANYVAGNAHRTSAADVQFAMQAPTTTSARGATVPGGAPPAASAGFASSPT